MKRRSRLLCWLLTGLMITTSCPVTAYAEQTTQFQEEVEQEETTDVPVEKEELENSKVSAGDFEISVANDTEITIKKYNGSSNEVNLSQVDGWVNPGNQEIIEGAKVVEIGKEAFKGNNQMSKLILPNTVKTINESAFRTCGALTSVSFAGEEVELTTIGKHAFDGCTYLSDFTFPEKLGVIDQYAFSGTGFSTVKLPASVTSVGIYAFSSCKSLDKVYVNNPNTGFGDSTFSGIKDKITICAEYGSGVQKYAIEKGINFNGFADSISVNSYPEKLTYYYKNKNDQTLNTTGFSLLVNFTSYPEPVEVKADACVFSGYDYEKLGKQTITVSYADLTTTFDVDVYYNVANVTIKGLSNKTYTGKPIIPEITLTGKDTGVVLTEGVDYEVEGINNLDVGKATLRVTGIGNYGGTLEKTFDINRKAIGQSDVVATFPTVTYSGTQQTPVPVISYNGIELTENDFEIKSYGTNINAGTGTVYISGKGNYINNRTLSFTINPKELSEMTVKDIPDQVYTGREIKPNIEIPITDFESLVEGKDYTVKFIQNTENGTARVAITGKGNYTGVVEKSFVIKPKSLEDVKIEEIVSQTYTGKEVKPSLNVYDEQRNVKLVEGTDYEVTYVNNVDVGTATVSFNGLNNYEGTMEKNFTIEPAQMEELNLTLSNVDAFAYTGEALEPSFELNLDDDTVLVKDTDYTVSYKDNVNAGTATIVIAGKGNYKGTIEQTFTIEPIKLDDATVNDLPGYTYAGEPIKPAIDVKLDGVSLASGKDYTVKYYDNTNVGTATVIIEGKGNYTGEIVRTFDIRQKSLANIGIRNIPDHMYTGSEIRPVVSLELDVYTTLTAGVDYMVIYENNVNVGTATVKVQGIGNYVGTLEKTFKITKATLAGASVVVTPTVDYTGEVLQPVVSVVLGNKTLYQGSEYAVTYQNNKNIGTATVVVTGIGNYTGSVAANFAIQAKKGSSFYVGAYKYKVTSASEVAFAGLKNSSTKKVTIPAEVKIGGKKFKVTSVANKALKGKAVTSVTVGKNVKTVGKSAFEKCSKLKKITFKGKALKKVNKKAFKGIHKNAVIKVPKKKLAAYKKLMNKKGQSSSVKIK